MTLDRRIARIEESLSPTQLVIRWLDEAHAFGDVPAYTAAVLATDPPELPLDRLAQEAARGARSATRGKRPEIVDAAVRSALRETVFRFELVMRINVTAHDLLEREALMAAALSAHVCLLVSADQKVRRSDPTYTERFITLRDLLVSRLAELQAAGEARSIAEGRYLDGHPALFPQLAKAWQGQCRESEVIADMAARLAAFDDVPTCSPPDPESLSGRTAQLVADLVEPAKVEPLDKLGEGSRAFDIASGWVRAKLVPSPSPDPTSL
jgi:hypothetical protein